MMSLWFDRGEQEAKFLSYMPKGKAYKQAGVQGTNFNNLIIWIAMAFRRMVDKYNQTFKGVYVCESDYLIDNWRKDFNIPNEVFYLSDSENRTDVFVLKYLMRGNKEWNFQAIANIYGVRVKIYNGYDYFKGSRLPNRIPHKLYDKYEDVANILVVIFLQEKYDELPHKVPHKLGSGTKLEKIKKIYGIIKEAECKIMYMPIRHDGDILEILEVDSIKFCDGVSL